MNMQVPAPQNVNLFLFHSIAGGKRKRINVEAGSRDPK
jgi:hypothetical protein